jgi:hypothetical protein
MVVYISYDTAFVIGVEHFCVTAVLYKGLKTYLREVNKLNHFAGVVGNFDVPFNRECI